HDQPPEPGVAPDLARIIRKCLVKDREERYQSIKDVAIDLREAKTARKGIPVVRKRRILPFGAATAVAIAIVVAIGITRDRQSAPAALAAPAFPQPVMLR